MMEPARWKQIEELYRAACAPANLQRNAHHLDGRHKFSRTQFSYLRSSVFICGPIVFGAQPSARRSE